METILPTLICQGLLLIYPYSVWGTQIWHHFTRPTGDWQWWPSSACCVADGVAMLAAPHLHGLYENRETQKSHGLASICQVWSNLPMRMWYPLYFQTFPFGPQRGMYYQIEISFKASPNHIEPSHNHCQIQEFTMIGSSWEPLCARWVSLVI